MKQGNAEIRRKQVKQISVFRAWWPLREFSRYVSRSMAFFCSETLEPKVYANGAIRIGKTGLETNFSAC